MGNSVILCDSCGSRVMENGSGIWECDCGWKFSVGTRLPKPISKQTWYILYGGTSVDGRGDEVFVERTTNYKKAKKHLKRNAKNPYFLGSVDVITDEYKEKVFSVDELKKLV